MNGNNEEELRDIYEKQYASTGVSNKTPSS